jgi:hypothetical protein
MGPSRAPCVIFSKLDAVTMNDENESLIEAAETTEPAELSVTSEPVRAVKEYPAYVKAMLSLVEKNPDRVGRNPIVEDRCFMMTSGRAIFGFCLAELSDSFLVGLASTLQSEDGTIDGKMITSNPVLRIFKSSVNFVAIPEFEHKYYFYRYALDHTEFMEEYFTDERIEYMLGVINRWESTPKKGKTAEQEAKESYEEEDGPELFKMDRKFSLYDSKTRH